MLLQQQVADQVLADLYLGLNHGKSRYLSFMQDHPVVVRSELGGDYLHGFGHRLNARLGTTRSSLDFMSTSFDTTVL